MKRIKKVFVTLMFLVLIILTCGCSASNTEKQLSEYNKKVNEMDFSLVSNHYYNSGFGLGLKNCYIGEYLGTDRIVYIPYTKDDVVICCIGPAAFAGCDLIEEINAFKPTSGESKQAIIIEKYAFYNCKSLSNIDSLPINKVLMYGFYNTAINAESIVVCKADTYSFAEISGTIKCITLKPMNIEYEGLQNVYVGSYAFKNTRVEEIKICGAIDYLAENCFASINASVQVYYEGNISDLKNQFDNAIANDKYNPCLIGIDTIICNDGNFVISEVYSA